MTTIELKQHHQHAPTVLVDAIAEASGLAKSAVKRGLTFGGGWIKLAGDKQLKRCRKAKQAIQAGDYYEFYYDAQLLAAPIPQPTVILETPHWGIWYKPVNQVAQGSRFGDANCLEVCVKRSRAGPVFLVHRLDREASGLLMLAYTPQAAAALSQLWAGREIQKGYQARVLGAVAPTGDIELELDGKPAHTHYTLAYHAEDNASSAVDVRLYTGRLHQIRRHFAAIGHPLLGDPKYGEGNRFSGGLQLVASRLSFPDPCNQQQLVDCVLPLEKRLF